ncbi:MAG: FKBP-type peptidyl-prolyl cis-trans isomerase [Bacteriovoracaceae bacterium]
MKKILFLATLSSLLFVSCNKQGGTANPSTEEDKTFYSVGVMFGERLQNLKLSDKEIQMLQAGLVDSVKGSKLKVEPGDYQKKIQDTFQARINAANEKTKVAGVEFLEKFVKTEGATKTKSGLAYKIVKAGEGKAPKETDIVEVHYKGTLIDGTEFDSSYKRNKTVSFPLNRVIKGWTEGLQLIKEGGKMKMVIPSELAYGDRGAPPNIPGGATLIFDVELFKVSASEEVKKSPKK